MRRAALLLLLVACKPLPERAAPSKATPVSQVDPPPFTPPAGFARLRIGVVPSFSPETLQRTHARLATYLSKRLSVPAEVVVPATYAEAIDRVVAGDFELVSLSPVAYVRAAERVKLNCLVQSIADGSATASGYVFVRDDSPRRSIGDLKGASFAFVDSASTAGFLFPLKLLRENGLEPERDFSKVVYLGNHEAVLMAVYDGTVEAGATYQGAFTALRRARGLDARNFRVIGKTSRMPRDIFCVRADVPAEVASALTSALLDLKGSERAGREVLAPMELNGFTKANDAAFDGVRSVSREVDAGP